jgi:hypothetical protein
MVVVHRIKQLYTTQNQKAVERAATILPLSLQVRVLHATLTEISGRHADVAHAVATLDMVKVARYIHAEYMPVVRKAFDAGKEIAGAGTAAEALDAVRRLEHGLHSLTDQEFESSFNNADKLVKRLAGTATYLQRKADALVAALSILEAAESLASPAVIVPPPTVEAGR